MRTKTVSSIFALVLLILSVSADPGLGAAELSVTLDITELGKLIWEIWKAKSAEAKASVGTDELLREMNLLVAQREVFIPRFKKFVLRPVPPSEKDFVSADLRPLALQMRSTVARIETMLKKIDPHFAAAESEVHIKATSVAEERRYQTREAIRLLDGRGAEIDASDLVRRLDKGTCDLRQVIHDIRKASAPTPPALSEEDKRCGVTAATSTP